MDRARAAHDDEAVILAAKNRGDGLAVGGDPFGIFEG
jgi:hypothetical protein